MKNILNHKTALYFMQKGYAVRRYGAPEFEVLVKGKKGKIELHNVDNQTSTTWKPTPKEIEENRYVILYKILPGNSKV